MKLIFRFGNVLYLHSLSFKMFYLNEIASRIDYLGNPKGYYTHSSLIELEKLITTFKKL